AGEAGVRGRVGEPAAAGRAGAWLLHAPHCTLPLAWGGPAVVTIHDLIHIRFARFHPPGAAAYARAMAGLAVRRAAVVAADSEAPQRGVVELLRAPGAKGRGVPLRGGAGLRPPAARGGAGLPPPPPPP